LAQASGSRPGSGLQARIRVSFGLQLSLGSRMSPLCTGESAPVYHLVAYLHPNWNVHGVFQALAPAATEADSRHLLPHSPSAKPQKHWSSNANTAPVAPEVKQESDFSEEGQITGRVWRLSRDARGCRKVQQALETATDDEECAAIAAELKGHIWEAVRCPHANHVIQKCIIMLRPRSVQFILDEIMEGPIVFQAVRHKYGCRVVQRLVEQCLPDQVHRLAEAILSDAYWLSRHPYGNYVVQHLLEHGMNSQCQRIMESVAANLHGLAWDAHGRSVVNACLFHGPAEGKAVLAHALLQEPFLLKDMSQTRHGRLAARIAQEMLH